MRNYNIGRRFGRLYAVRASLSAGRHLDLCLCFEFGLLLVAERAERSRRRVGVDAVIGTAIARAIFLAGEKTLSSLACAVAHLGRFVHLE